MGGSIWIEGGAVFRIGEWSLEKEGGYRHYIKTATHLRDNFGLGRWEMLTDFDFLDRRRHNLKRQMLDVHFLVGTNLILKQRST